MSGYYDRLGYDKCAIKMQYAQSVADGNYALYAGSVVNPKFFNKTSVICKKKNGCNKFEQKNATIGLDYSDAGKRVDLEDSLRGTNRIITKCSPGHFLPCAMGNGPGRVKGECDEIRAFNPLIHERELFVTNMDIDFEQGFGDSY